MEGNCVYEDSLAYIKKLCIANTTHEIDIDYDRLDCNTQGELREAIRYVLLKRLKEVQGTISGVSPEK